MTEGSFTANFNREYPDYVNPDGTHKLNCRWVLWSHDNGKGWTEDDYTRHAVISTVEGFWEIYNGLPSLNNKDMWFLMREGIPPIWEAPINLEGGSFKFKIEGNSVDNTWLILSLHLVTENMCLNIDDAQTISGIGLSPKQKNYATISVWNIDSTNTEHVFFPKNIDGINFKTSKYDSHRKLVNGYNTKSHGGYKTYDD